MIRDKNKNVIKACWKSLLILMGLWVLKLNNFGEWMSSFSTGGAIYIPFHKEDHLLAFNGGCFECAKEFGCGIKCIISLFLDK